MSTMQTEDAGLELDPVQLNENPGVPSIVLVGNPNSGKTTIFNYLTGHHHKVANYPGVTVERREGKFSHKQKSIKVVDLPGIYSLSGLSEDERIAERELRLAEAQGSLFLAVLDASNLDRSLYLVSELLDLHPRLLLVLNMSDIAERDGIKIKEIILSRLLNVPVVLVTAKNRKGLVELQELIVKTIKTFEKKSAQVSTVGEALGSSPSEQNSNEAPLPPEVEVQTVGQQSECKTGPASAAYAWTLADPKLEALARTAATSLSMEDSSRIASARYAWIREILSKTVVHEKSRERTRSDQIDRVLLHPVLGGLVFVFLMLLVFQAVFSWASWPMDLIESFMEFAGEWVSSLLPEGILRSLIVDGVIAGVGSVVIFVPQIAILFFLIGLLEESGYLSRAAVIMDRLMRPVGLQGRSFIPLLSSFACAVPGIMATRTIPSQADRLLTILIAPLMSCSARLPVYALLIAAFIPTSTVWGIFSLQGLTLFGLYLVGVLAAGIIAFIFKKTLLRGRPSMFVMEMPRYKVPLLRSILLEVYDRVKIFIKNAGTIILACSIILWFLASFPKAPDGHTDIRNSYAGRIGLVMEPVIKPLGYDWELGVALLASFAAREVFISSLATIYNVDSSTEDLQSISEVLQERRASGRGWGLPTALSLLVFYAFACQCMSTLAVCKRETAGWFWPSVMFAYMTGLAYVSAWAVYHLALAFL